jgi:hypothetical protein
MTAQKPFRRYWAITPDGLGLVIKEDHADPHPDALVQVDNGTRWHYLARIRPATFKEFCWRDDGFAGTNYTLFFAVCSFCVVLLVYGLFFGGQFPELWGRIVCILAGPAIIGTWVLGTWMNFKRYWV